jgi:transposase
LRPDSYQLSLSHAKVGGGRTAVDPELMIRMLIVSYCFGIRSERRLCEEVHLKLAYRWFCRLGLEDPVPNHSTFSKNRHGRFRDSEAFRQLFESVLSRCMAEGLVRGEGFATDASIIKANAQEELRAIEEFEPMQILPRTREIYRDLVARLGAIDNVAVAREALRDFIGEVRLMPKNGSLTAEIQSAGLAGTLQISMVAGARFELATFGL